MPIHAAAFVVSVAQLAKLGELAEKDDVDAFWDLIHSGGRRVQPEFPHTGYVVAVALEFLEEQGLHVVAADPGPDADRISDASLGLQACLTRRETAAVVESLGQIRATESELLSYYDEFAEEPLAHAGKAMLDALEFLKRSCSALSSDEERLLLFVG